MPSGETSKNIRYVRPLLPPSTAARTAVPSMVDVAEVAQTW
jgi:hypothetical protein